MTGRGRTTGAVVRRTAVRLGDLVVPYACAGCGARGVTVCDACLALVGGPVRCEDGAARLDRTDGLAPLPVWTLADLAGPVHRAVVAWKDGGRRDLDRVLAGRVRAAGLDLAPALRAALDAPGAPGPLVVVHVPSSPRAAARRGCVPVAGLADALAAGLAAGGVRVVRPRAAVLRRRAGVRDQAGLGRDARARNLAGALVARRARGAPVIVVDDVLTTGATLAAAHDALRAAGWCVLGAVTLAATPSAPGGSRSGPGDVAGPGTLVLPHGPGPG